MTYNNKVLIIILFMAIISVGMSLDYCTSCTQSTRESIARSIPNTDSDLFSGTTLSSKWIVINKNVDSNLSLTGTELRMIASPNNGGSDYWNGTNYNALRILQPVTGDWIIETKMNFLPTNIYQAAGIMLCGTPDSDSCRRIAERVFYPNNGGYVVRTLGKTAIYNYNTTYFIIAKKDNYLDGWYSSDGVNWKGFTGQNVKDFFIKDYVGLFVISRPNDNNKVDSVAYFEYFNITPLSPELSKNTNSSISFKSEKTDVTLNEDIILTLSAVNLINKPKMHIQIIIIPPSGLSVTSSEFSKVEAGQYANDYDVYPGSGRDIDIKLRANQVGSFNINGRAIYYFGDDINNSEDIPLNQLIRVKNEKSSEPKNSDMKSTPGFDIFISLFVLFILGIYYMNSCDKQK